MKKRADLGKYCAQMTLFSRQALSLKIFHYCHANIYILHTYLYSVLQNNNYYFDLFCILVHKMTAFISTYPSKFIDIFAYILYFYLYSVQQCKINQNYYYVIAL